MQNLTPVIRNAVRAVIVREERILLLKKTGGERGERFALPGGAQDLGETLRQALDRECLEEIGTTVEILSLLHVADFFKARETVPPSTRHLVEFLFHCAVPDDYVARSGHKPDKSQVDVVWADLADLPTMKLFPRSLSNWLPAGLGGQASVYIGTLD